MDSVEQALVTYSESKDEYDAKLLRAVKFEYNMPSSFSDDSGNKVPSFISHTAAFVDCSNLSTDFATILTETLKILTDMNPVLSSILDSAMKEFLDETSEERFACSFVPQLNIMLQHHNELYFQDGDSVN